MARKRNKNTHSRRHRQQMESGGQLAHRKVHELELSWRGLKRERGAYVSGKTGKVLKHAFSFGGFAAYMPVPYRSRGTGILTHWHPGAGGSFSFQDIRLGIMSGVKEIRAATETGVFVMQITEAGTMKGQREFGRRKRLCKRLKKEFRQAGFSTSLTVELAKWLKFRLAHGKEEVLKLRMEGLDKVDEFWHEFALRTPGFVYSKQPLD